MSSLVYDKSKFQLSSRLLDQVLEKIKRMLVGRVDAAYVFGSASTKLINPDSDIDLILIVPETEIPFVKRGIEFKDLFDVYPKLDLLIYTQKELDQQLSDSETGFWKSARESLRKL